MPLLLCHDRFFQLLCLQCTMHGIRGSEGSAACKNPHPRYQQQLDLAGPLWAAAARDMCWTRAFQG